MAATLSLTWAGGRALLRSSPSAVPGANADWGGTTGAFADPDGYVWEVAHNPGWTVNEDGTVDIRS